MDGLIRLGNRTLSIQFLNARHSQDSFLIAYQRIELPAIAAEHPQDSVQVAVSKPLKAVSLVSEIQG